MQTAASSGDIQAVVDRLKQQELGVHVSRGKSRTVVGAIGDLYRVDRQALEAMAGVDRVVSVSTPYKLAGRDFKQDDTLVNVSGTVIGGKGLVICAGPCAVESSEQLDEAAEAVASAGAQVLRGGAFKPRTSPYSFQGLEEEGLELLSGAGHRHGLKVVTEVMSPGDVELVARHADMLQIGARSMQNFPLLKEVGQTRMPVLLKRGMSATIKEWLMAAEYVLAGGNSQVVLCERGIRTFENQTRNTLDLSAVAAVKQLSHLPVIVDPSHSTGSWKYVEPMAMAAVAAGADGLIIEVHPQPDQALCDGPQSLTPSRFRDLVPKLDAVAQVLGRHILRDESPEPALAARN